MSTKESKTRVKLHDERLQQLANLNGGSSRSQWIGWGIIGVLFAALGTIAFTFAQGLSNDRIVQQNEQKRLEIQLVAEKGRVDAQMMQMQSQLSLQASQTTTLVGVNSRIESTLNDFNLRLTRMEITLEKKK